METTKQVAGNAPTDATQVGQAVEIQNGKAVTSSLKVGEVFKKQHKDVLKAIRDLECSTEFSERNFAPTHYKDVQGKERPMYIITKDGFTLLAMGFTGKEAMKFKEAYIKAFNEMERALSAPEQPAVQELVAELGQRWGGARAVWVDGRYFVCLRQVLMFLGIGSASSDSFLAGIATKDKMLYKAPGQTTRAWYVLEERFVNLPNYMRIVPGIFYEEIAAMKGAKALPVATTAVAKPDNTLQSINRCLYLLGRNTKISADVRTEVMDLLYQLGEKGGQNA